MTKSSRKEMHEPSHTVADAEHSQSHTSRYLDLVQQQGQAQRQFDQAIHEGQLLLYRALLDAQREYTSRLEEAQRDLEGFALEAYQRYLAGQTDTSVATSALERGADAYQELLRSMTELSAQGSFGKSVLEAYGNLATALGAPLAALQDPKERSADAYRQFGDRLNEAWKQAEQIQGRLGQTFAACTVAWKDALAKRQQSTDSAYQTYVANLKEAYARGEFDRRASEAAQAYLAAVETAWKQAQATYSKAVVDMVNAGKSIADSVNRASAA
jgi:hypothetical protein